MALTSEMWFGAAGVVAIAAVVFTVLGAELALRSRGRQGVVLVSHHATMALIEVIIFATLAFILLCSVAM